MILLNGITQIAGLISINMLNKHVIPLLFELVNDKVPSIRMNAVKTLSVCFTFT